MEPKTLHEETLKLLEEAKTDTSAQEELRGLVMDNTSEVFAQWISKMLAQVQLGHSLFIYQSKAKRRDYVFTFMMVSASVFLLCRTTRALTTAPRVRAVMRRLA